MASTAENVVDASSHSEDNLAAPGNTSEKEKTANSSNNEEELAVTPNIRYTAQTIVVPPNNKAVMLETETIKDIEITSEELQAAIQPKHSQPINIIPRMSTGQETAVEIIPEFETSNQNCGSAISNSSNARYPNRRSAITTIYTKDTGWVSGTQNKRAAHKTTSTGRNRPNVLARNVHFDPSYDGERSIHEADSTTSTGRDGEFHYVSSRVHLICTW